MEVSGCKTSILRKDKATENWKTNNRKWKKSVNASVYDCISAKSPQNSVAYYLS